MTVPVFLIAALTLMGTSAAVEGDAKSLPLSAPAEISSSKQFEVHSKADGRTYLVKVALPDGPAPAGGFPVLYVLDGGTFFGSITEAVRERAGANEIAPAVVVGIAYPQEASTELRRQYDFTPTPPSEYEKANFPDIPKGGEYGGAEAFYNVIEQEITPRIAEVAHVDSKRPLLFGWSLGGLFVLYTMFNHPKAFQGYVALSPSIWLNGKAVLKNESAFSVAVNTRRIAPRVFLGVGAREQTATKDRLPPGMSIEKMTELEGYASMVDNVKQLARRLKGLDGSADYKATLSVFPGETHNSEPWAAINPILDFLLPPEPRGKN